MACRGSRHSVMVRAVTTFVQLTSFSRAFPDSSILATNPAFINEQLGRSPPATKLMATIGPASEGEKVLGELIEGGVTGFRVNMSHVLTRDDRLKALRWAYTVRRLAREREREVALIADLKGPEFRTRCGKGKKIPLEAGEGVILTTGQGGVSRKVNGRRVIHVAGPEGYDLLGDIRDHSEGAFQGAERPLVLIADGRIGIELNSWDELFYRSRRIPGLLGTVRFPDLLEDNKGINFPTLVLRLPGLVPEDREVLRDIFSVDFAREAWGVFKDGKREARQLSTLGFDFVAPSFVRSVDDLNKIVELLEEAGAGFLDHVKLIPKIETVEAVNPDVLQDLLSHPMTRGVMVARGDLAAQVGFEAVPFCQNEIVRLAREHGCFSIVATDVLGSMTGGAQRAKRAENGDLHGMIEHGAHCIMLSDETTKGKDPAYICRHAFGIFASSWMEGALATGLMRQAQRRETLERLDREVSKGGFEYDIREARLYLRVVHEIATADQGNDVDGIVLWCERGRSLRWVSQVLPQKPVILVTHVPRVAREAALTRGMFPILVNEKPGSENELKKIIESAVPVPQGRDLHLLLIHNLPD